ncbi:glycerol kinase [Blastomonas marina]|uniref:Glycerol kinase n=1 Tax=Blastomonas marina TaxID=1867408 RepID=A0ABQ1FGQ6_9SPHN|nr:glycerol kinase GlpK [Blastomonas marina]GGA09950.1 glycerol kinase [Blastomonas marina]
MSQFILVLDAGTTSTRAMLFDRAGALHHTTQREFTQHYPQPGWVEHDAAEIWDETLACLRAAIAAAGGRQNVAALGISNQRETVVAWDRGSGEPLARAIVWQDRRTAAFCAELKGRGEEAGVTAKTGLLLDPYFSATKMRWMLDHVPAVGEAAKSGNLVFGTIESWLVFKLSRAHITDASNASRTLLMALDGEGWDADLCELFGVPAGALAEIVDNAGTLAVADGDPAFAGLPICGLAGDQQAATIGQACLSPGETKATYGTGAFVLTNQGTTPPSSGHRLLGTVLYQLDGERHYALEGSVFVAGSLVKWLRDTLGLIESSAETEVLARSVADSGGVVVVPALSGLGAPHWKPEARGVVSGLSFASGRPQIVRAALESMALQTRDLATAFAADGTRWETLRIDGGMAANDWIAQDLADMLDLPVERPAMLETTALGAAMLAAHGCGWYASLEDAAEAMAGQRSRFDPAMDDEARSARIAAWEKALLAV